MTTLSPKQRRFVDEFLVDLNATQAAIRAGYSKRTARSQSSALMTKPDISEAIAAGKARAAERAGISQERVLRELAAIALSDLRSLYRTDGTLKPPSEWDDQAAAAVASLEVDELRDGEGAVIGFTRKVKRFDKVRALELLGKHLGLWQEPVPPPVVGPGLTVIVNQAPAGGVTLAAGPAAHQVVVTLAQPEIASR